MVPERTMGRRHITPGAFQRALESAAAAATTKEVPAVHNVRAGETLWSICRAHLRQLGCPSDASAVAEAIQQVARHNHIKDADYIVVGQQIDLSMLDTSAKVASRGTSELAITKTSAQSKSAAAGGPSAVSNPRSNALWRAKKAVLQTKGAFSGFLKDEAVSEPAKATEKSFGGLLGGPARLSSGFGMRKDPFTGRMQQHDGLDLAAAKGTKVYPMQEGRVTYSGWRGNYGRLIIVQHEDGTETRYGHLSERLVKEGDSVGANTVIGKVGSSGRSTGAHLHFELREGSRPVNPLPHVRQEMAYSM
ncbi:MAG: M23 family metallopeptidase [Candidatus Hydrogenedentota bacterium]